MASYTVTVVTANSITVSVTGVSVGDILKFPIRYTTTTATISSAEVKVIAVPFLYTWTGLSPSTTYVFNVGTSPTGAAPWTFIGSTERTTASAASTPSRPSNWNWSSVIATGYPVNITASEWNSFCTRINDFRAYSGLVKFTFTTVYKGTPISADIVNQALYAIRSIPTCGATPGEAFPGNKIYASFFNTLRSALNAIP